ncbi:ZinT family metal-binding protein [Agrobacterium sp. rho-8.1]|nr:metal-binding protein ZinT [Agrobacterium sp. rho-8.1]
MNIRYALTFAIGSLLLSSATTMADDAAASAKSHSYSQAHDHSEASEQISKGYFEDSQIRPRPLSDWEGEWQSVYPYLLDGSLDPVMADKAKHGDKTAKDYRGEYDVGYKTDVDRIVIDGETVMFQRKDARSQATYVSDGYEVLTYKKGNRGVRYIFKKNGGDEAAPQFIQFSDHTITPTKAGHYHLFWGNDRKVVLAELSNWPTYYPASLDAKQIVHEMLEH